MPLQSCQISVFCTVTAESLQQIVTDVLALQPLQFTGKPCYCFTIMLKHYYWNYTSTLQSQSKSYTTCLISYVWHLQYMKNTLATQLIAVKAPLCNLQYPPKLFYFLRRRSRANLTQYLQQNIGIETFKGREIWLTSNPNSRFQAHLPNALQDIHAKQVSHTKKYVQHTSKLLRAEKTRSKKPQMNLQGQVINYLSWNLASQAWHLNFMVSLQKS